MRTRGDALPAESRHAVRRADEAAFSTPARYAEHSEGFRRWAIVDARAPSVHTGFGICELDGGGSIRPHVHSFELSFYVLAGNVELTTSEGSGLLREGDYGLVPIGMPHGWRSDGAQPTRWVDMLAPQPRTRFDGDTLLLPERSGASPSSPVDVRDPRTRSFGHIEPANMYVDQQTQERLAVSASMRTALLVYSGITVKMMVDTDLGAQLSTMFMVQYEPGGFAGAHDHPFEETYLILEGEVEAAFDGERFLLRPGDTAFAGVGCVHEFNNRGDGPVRWLETQAPQPPARHSYRFVRDWNYLRDRLS